MTDPTAEGLSPLVGGRKSRRDIIFADHRSVKWHGCPMEPHWWLSPQRNRPAAGRFGSFRILEVKSAALQTTPTTTVAFRWQVTGGFCLSNRNYAPTFGPRRITIPHKPPRSSPVSKRQTMASTSRRTANLSIRRKLVVNPTSGLATATVRIADNLRPKGQ